MGMNLNMKKIATNQRPLNHWIQRRNPAMDQDRMRKQPNKPNPKLSRTLPQFESPTWYWFVSFLFWENLWKFFPSLVVVFSSLDCIFIEENWVIYSLKVGENYIHNKIGMKKDSHKPVDVIIALDYIFTQQLVNCNYKCVLLFLILTGSALAYLMLL